MTTARQTQVAPQHRGELATLQVRLRTVGKLPVGELGQSGQGGAAGHGHGWVEVAGRHGGQRAEHGAKMVWRSLLLAADLFI